MADMTYRRLGNSGLTVSVVGLGCNSFGSRVDLNGTRAIIDAAIEQGITFFDTSDSYSSSEELMGECLQGRREKIILATKFGNPIGGRLGEDYEARGSRWYIKKAVESSLRRLRTDWIDLYQLHNPDPHTPVEETLSALNDLVHEGKVRYIGHSNHDGWQIADAEWTARSSGYERYISAQNRYNLIERDVEREVTPACLRFGLGIIPYVPIASGLLTGKVKRGVPPAEGTKLFGRNEQLTDARFDTVERLEAFAHDRGISMLEVAIGGLAAKPAVASVIAGATRPDQVVANAAAGSWQPSAEDLAALNAIY